MLFLQGCVSEPPRVITLTKISCSTVPYVELSIEDLIGLDDAGFYHIIEQVDKQSLIIDGCKK